MSIGNPLRIGVFRPSYIPQSFKVYADNICRCLEQKDIAFVAFADASTIPRDVKLIWDIRCGGGNPPPDFLLTPGLPPLVVTIHGFAPMSLPAWEYNISLKSILLSPWSNKTKRDQWALVRDKIQGVIAISEFTKQEILAIAGVDSQRITVCHHGVEGSFFFHVQDSADPPYFLHVSNDEPRKNIRRIVRTFTKLRKRYPIGLTLKLPREAAERYQGIEGARVISGYIQDAELASLYRGALAFLFPSLYEGFGFPILEAMASGCPVITSNISACPEVAGDAAVIIDPRSEKELLHAMEMFCQSPSERSKYVMAGLERASRFSWAASAECHKKAFMQALAKA